MFPVPSPESIAGLSGPDRKDPPGQLNGVVPLPGTKADGDVMAATGGSFVPPGVSGGAPNDCSNGLGSRLRDPPPGLEK